MTAADPTTTRPRITIIAAVSENGVIGRGGGLPWHLPEDLRRFKRRTLGHTLVMGRRTFESLGGCLPGRRCIVVSRTPSFAPEGVTVAASLADALAAAGDDDEVFIAGGSAVYREGLAVADRLELTIVHADVEGDAFFPEYDPDAWRVVGEERHEADDRHPHAFTFRVCARR
ncbi:MAG: dihydrofolate reductase [Planctomycetota bacterium]